jgi:hypothetical protein
MPTIVYLGHEPLYSYNTCSPFYDHACHLTDVTILCKIDTIDVGHKFQTMNEFTHIKCEGSRNKIKITDVILVTDGLELSFKSIIDNQSKPQKLQYKEVNDATVARLASRK